jgi:hypothetical protein
MYGWEQRSYNGKTAPAVVAPNIVGSRLAGGAPATRVASEKAPFRRGLSAMAYADRRFEPAGNGAAVPSESNEVPRWDSG